MATVVYRFRLEEELLERLLTMAKKNRRSGAEEVRIAIEDRIKANGRKKAA